MLEEFKRLKIWVEKCPIEAAMRIEDLERKQNDYTETLNETRRSRDKAKGRLEVALKEIKLRRKHEKILKEIACFTKYEGNQWYEKVKKALEDNA